MDSLPTKRATQLDGLRALAMIGICWDHWVPEAWSFGLPFEIGLYFFLVLSGYLITGSLLRIREKEESQDSGWRWRAWKEFQWRRGLRIMAPYYAALFLAAIFLGPKLWSHLHWYALYLGNFHIALLGEWPDGVSHFWSIAIQQQFYLIWPALVWLTPKRFLALAMILFAGIAGLWGYFEHLASPPFIWPHKLSLNWFDFLGIGGLMALAIHRGLPLASKLWKLMLCVCSGAYLLLKFGIAPAWIGPFSGTILAFALCGVIATASIAWRNPLGRLLESKVLQKVGLLSYGVYLYHNLAPIILGKLLPFLWFGSYSDSVPQTLLRTLTFAALTWALTLASWKYIETPLDQLRSRDKLK